MDVEEAGANPARSRHCHRGAILTIGHCLTPGGKAEGSDDPGARRLRTVDPSTWGADPWEDRIMTLVTGLRLTVPVRRRSGTPRRLH
jgi:hypothetical protein